MISGPNLSSCAVLAVVLGLILVPGCGGATDETAPTTRGGAAEPATASAPGGCGDPVTGPARGRIAGQEFTVESGKLENGILELRQGADFFADRSLTLFLFLDEGEIPGGRSFEHDGEGFGGPHIHMGWRTDAESLPETEVFMSDYELSLSFGREADGRLSGRIHVCLPDEHGSFVSGTFTAAIEGFRLTNGRPDYSQDSHRNFEYLAADYLREERGTEDVEIVEKERSFYTVPDDETIPTGSVDVTYRVAGEEPETRRFAFVKDNGVWRIDAVLGMNQLIEAHAFGSATPATDERAAIARLVARVLEARLQDRYPGRAIYPSGYQSVIESYSHSNDSAEVTAGYEIEGLDEPMEQHFRLVREPSGWKLAEDI